MSDDHCWFVAWKNLRNSQNLPSTPDTAEVDTPDTAPDESAGNNSPHGITTGDIPAAPEDGGRSGLLVYTIGLIAAVVLTALSFWVANTSLLWGPGAYLGLAVLAIAQMGVHLVFFLHIGTGPDSTNNVLAVAFGVLIVFLVVAGSLWIMSDLNAGMMPMRVNATMH